MADSTCICCMVASSQGAWLRQTQGAWHLRCTDATQMIADTRVPVLLYMTHISSNCIVTCMSALVLLTHASHHTRICLNAPFHDACSHSPICSFSSLITCLFLRSFVCYLFIEVFVHSFIRVVCWACIQAQARVIAVSKQSSPWLYCPTLHCVVIAGHV